MAGVRTTRSGKAGAGGDRCPPAAIGAAGPLALPLTARLVATARAVPTWIAMLPDAPDERRVVIVENAEALPDPAFIARFPPETALVLVTNERVASRRRTRTQRDEPAAADLAAVTTTSLSVELNSSSSKFTVLELPDDNTMLNFRCST